MNGILMTSGFDFEGYSITEYLGVYSGECALGTGFLSSLGSGFADFFGSNSTMYSDKLKRAKDHAINQLVSQVQRVGGNAIIGLDIDYTTFSADIMGVIANGTAVKIIKNESIIQVDEEKIVVRSTNRNLPFRAVALLVDTLRESYSVSLDIYCPENRGIVGILADIQITTIFNDYCVINDLVFINFSDGAKNHLISDASQLDIPANIFQTIKSVNVIVKKYIEKDEVIEITEQDIEDAGDNAENESSGFSVDDFIYSMESLSSAKEILNYIKEYNEGNGYTLNPALIEEIEKVAYIERLYGNRKETCINKVRNFFEEYGS